MRNFLRLSSAVVASALISGVAGAQVTANMTATTTITSSLAVTAAAGVTGTLRFGNLVQGAGATTIAPTSANAGRFDVTGVAASPLTISYTSLPATLGGPGGQTIGVTSYQACFVQVIATGCVPQAISTVANMTGSPAISGLGVGYVYVGATLDAIGVAQVLGTYTGTITISITSP